MMKFNGLQELIKRSHARLILPLSAVRGELIHQRGASLAPALPLRQGVTMLDHKKYRFWNDGSLRHADRCFAAPGKAERKRQKRRRHFGTNHTY